jgi:electron transfer flavoprotein alpha subunit
MSILIYLETSEGALKKSSIEAAAYGAEVAKKLGTSAEAVYMGAEPKGIADAGQYGVTKVHHVNNAEFVSFNIQGYAVAVTEIAKKTGADVLVFAKSSNADAIVSRISIALQADVATNVVDLPDTASGFKVKRAIFTGKAFAQAELKSAKKVLVLRKNAISPQASGASASVEATSINLPALTVTTKEVNKATGQVLLPEAEIVVSGGRGLKGPENWGIIEDLAKTLGAATGCSKPVSDMDWRPHHEHVGQTGVKVSPNLYIAVGISGAIQHLAGVNSSRCIVVINKDSEAPFFKAADYGIVGDAFDVLPKLNEAFKKVL